MGQVQQLTLWPGERLIGRARIAASLRSLAVHGLAVRTRPDVYRYRLRELVWVAWGVDRSSALEAAADVRM